MAFTFTLEYIDTLYTQTSHDDDCFLYFIHTLKKDKKRLKNAKKKHLKDEKEPCLFFKITMFKIKNTVKKQK